jgi:hypothetical protein
VEVISITPGVVFEHPVPLPSSTVRPVAKSTGKKTSGNGVKKKRSTTTPAFTGKLQAEAAAEAREITRANRMMLVLSPTGKRTFVRLSEYTGD